MDSLRADPSEGQVARLTGLGPEDLHQLALETAGRVGRSADYRRLYDAHLRRLEDHHPATHRHSLRVSLLAAAVVASECRTGDASDVAAALLAGAAHDVGKRAVPAAVLDHPGKLGPAEWAQIRRHPEAGFQLLLPDDFRQAAVVAALHHRFQPKGYGPPRSAIGPVDRRTTALAKLVWLCDFVEAMTSRRDGSSRIDDPSDASAARAVALTIFPGMMARIDVLLGEPELDKAVGQ